MPHQCGYYPPQMPAGIYSYIGCAVNMLPFGFNDTINVWDKTEDARLSLVIQAGQRFLCRVPCPIPTGPGVWRAMSVALLEPHKTTDGNQRGWGLLRLSHRQHSQRATRTNAY